MPLKSVATHSVEHQGPEDPGPLGATEIAAMDSQQASRQVVDRGRRGCLVEGCPCKDPRIVSRRRSAFFAAWAQEHGETANRTVAPEQGWRISTLLSPAA
jgi:hypothetical protein